MEQCIVTRNKGAEKTWVLVVVHNVVEQYGNTDGVQSVDI
jgi:hypothetical protein